MGASQRLGLADFQALLDAKACLHVISKSLLMRAYEQWQPPQASFQVENTTQRSFLNQLAEAVYNFVQGGIAGGIGAFVRVTLGTAGPFNDVYRRCIQLI